MTDILGLGKDIHSFILTFLDIKSLLVLKHVCKYFNKYIYDLMENDISYCVKNLSIIDDFVLITPTYFITPMWSSSHVKTILPKIKDHIIRYKNSIKFINSFYIDIWDPPYCFIDHIIPNLLILRSNYIECGSLKLLYLELYSQKEYSSKIIRSGNYMTPLDQIHNEAETYIYCRSIYRYSEFSNVIDCLHDFYPNCKRIYLSPCFNFNATKYRDAKTSLPNVEELFFGNTSCWESFFAFLIKVLPNLKIVIVSDNFTAHSLCVIIKNLAVNIVIKVQNNIDWIIMSVLAANR